MALRCSAHIILFQLSHSVKKTIVERYFKLDNVRISDSHNILIQILLMAQTCEAVLCRINQLNAYTTKLSKKKWVWAIQNNVWYVDKKKKNVCYTLSLNQSVMVTG